MDTSAMQAFLLIGPRCARFATSRRLPSFVDHVQFTGSLVAGIDSFARQDARNRHFRSQHGVDPSPATNTVYKRLKKPSATHPSLLPKRRK